MYISKIEGEIGVGIEVLLEILSSNQHTKIYYLGGIKTISGGMLALKILNPIASLFTL